MVKQKRIFEFLLGLNKNLDEVRGRMIGTKPLTNLREAFSEVGPQREHEKGNDGNSRFLSYIREVSPCDPRALTKPPFQ